MVWIYVIATVVIFLILKELTRLPTVGKYGERYVFITGCDTSFGNELAKRLDSLGFNVFAACFTEKGKDELRKVSPARLKILSLDVTSRDSILKAKQTVEKQVPINKGLWAIVNNAGILGNLSDSEMLTRADYEACLAVNLYGVIDVTRAFQPLVRKEKGRIVNITSLMGRFAFLGCTYAVSKFGVEDFSDCLRREVLRQGMTVHILEPTFFMTKIVRFDDMFREMEKSYNAADPEVKKYYGRNFVQQTQEHRKSLISKVISLKTSHVVDAYTHAITAMFPRHCYVVGWDEYAWKLLWSLPESFSDWWITKFYAAPSGSL